MIVKYDKPYASGRRTGWAKTVTSVDMDQPNGYAFDGDFLKDGENAIEEGTIVIEMTPAGSAKTDGKEVAIYRAGDGQLNRVDDRDYDLKKEIESLKIAVADQLGATVNPLAEFTLKELEAEIERRKA